MPEEGSIIAVFCCVDDLLQSAPELLGFVGGASPPGSVAARRSRWKLRGVSGDDCDKAVWGHFRRHWQCLFPGLGSRSVFMR